MDKINVYAINLVKRTDRKATGHLNSIGHADKSHQ